MTANQIPSPSTLKRLIDYRPDTGEMFWIKRDREFFGSDANHASWNARHAGKAIRGASNGDGQIQVQLMGSKFLAIRIAWAIYHDEWPSGRLAVAEDDPRNWRISNLSIKPLSRPRKAATEAPAQRPADRAPETQYPAWMAPPLPELKVTRVFTSPLLEQDNKEAIEARLAGADKAATKARVCDELRTAAITGSWLSLADLVNLNLGTKSAIGTVLSRLVAADWVNTKLSEGPRSPRLYLWKVMHEECQ